MLLTACAPDTPPESVDVSAALGGDDVAGYLRADTPREFSFPEDHGPHPGFRNEWWYVVGNLDSEAGRRFGFQITFFRVALTPDVPESPSAWATDHVWMAHLAVTDVGSGAHHAFERFARGAAGLAGAELDPFRVWLEDWRLVALEGNDFPWRLQAFESDAGVDLVFDPRKPPVLQGDGGLSQKGAGEGNASYYYSMTRLDARGSLRIGDEVHEVAGSAWLDREWSTSALAEDQAGWDWFALQLDDDYELMYYQMRREDGSADPYSKGLIVAPDGGSKLIRREVVNLEVLRTWRSPTGRTYPVSWRLHVAPMGREFEIRAVHDAQEMNMTVRYWEGAVDVLEDGEPTGRGYVELTGY
ncbi:carotenoid 1,2-hydratase [Thioalkalivibrio denitrificans]|uniref:Carotenoid 1,2-hydratase n=1 Tax=Thioalkalivibrio denitrificans TaxID=108003 RepID=A0A1V3N8W6_9GAMM|nr:lipocalin-like domain-containing protein [Thioalkalivibrio denitrificans]OOG21475.1 carotenoid 1,2-hydratase [Thioalkalivibrio denitrificans]